jgi:hypothetical protein
MVADVHAPSEMKVFRAAGATGEQQKALETKIASVQGVAAVTPGKQVLDVRMSDPVSLAGSLLAVLSLNYVGNSLVPALDRSLPFLRLGDPGPAFMALSVRVVGASCVALVPCALLVRLPR